MNGEQIMNIIETNGLGKRYGSSGWEVFIRQIDGDLPGHDLARCSWRSFEPVRPNEFVSIAYTGEIASLDLARGKKRRGGHSATERRLDFASTG